MKKLFFIFLLFASYVGFSQGLYLNDRLIQSYTTYTMDGDTSYVIQTSTGYFFDIQFVWASLDQTDGSVKIQLSNDGTNYGDYPNTDSLLFNSASGAGAIRDTYKGTAAKYLKINVDSGTCTSGTLKVYARIETKK